MSASSTSCGSNGHQVTLQWTPPTNTGGQGVMITHYVLTGLPQSASCSTGPCDNITSTTTTITGLLFNDDGYNVSVSAVNCRGPGSASDPIMITVDVPGKTVILYTFLVLLSFSVKFSTIRPVKLLCALCVST